MSTDKRAYKLFITILKCVSLIVVLVWLAASRAVVYVYSLSELPIVAMVIKVCFLINNCLIFSIVHSDELFSSSLQLPLVVVVVFLVSKLEWP